MSTESEAPKSEGHAAGSAPFDPFEVWRAARDAGLESLRSMRDASMESSSKMMIDYVNSEAYSQATTQWLNTYLTVSQPFQQAIEKTMTQALTGLNMPTRADVISLATRLTNIEIRLDDLDAKLDEMQHAVQTLFTSKDDIQHAVQALSALKDAANRPASGAGGANTTDTPATPQPERKKTSSSQPGAKQGKAKEAH